MIVVVFGGDVCARWRWLQTLRGTPHRYVRWAATEPWECQAERPVDTSWVADVLKLLDYYAERTPGMSKSFIVFRVPNRPSRRSG